MKCHEFITLLGGAARRRAIKVNGSAIVTYRLD
jgi:hypothetical protein